MICRLFARRVTTDTFSMLQLAAAHTTEEIDIVRALLREYQQGAGTDLCFQGFEAELAALPGSYAPPMGRLLLARHAGEIIGCIALQRIDESRAEMKRLYVRRNARGLGAGRALVLKLLDEARAQGYTDIVLDTLPSMVEAQGLYAQLGFTDIQAYRPNPVGGTRFLGKSLR